MPEDLPSRSRNRRIIAVISIIAGIAWFALALAGPPPFLDFRDDFGWSLLFFLMLALPGTLAVWAGIVFFRDNSELHLRIIVGIMSTLITMIASVWLWSQPSDFIQEKASMAIWLIAFILLMGFIYPFSKSILLPIIGGERKKAREFFTKGFLIPLAWIFWLALQSLYQKYAA